MAIGSNYLYDLLPGVLGQLQQQNLKRLYFDNPVLWAEHHLGLQLWDRQGEIAMTIVKEKNIAVKAGHEVGKSFLAGVLICWWIDTRWDLPGGCFVVSTAPSTKQINAIVWREVRKSHALSRKRHAEYQRRKREGIELGEYQFVDHALPGYITSDAHWKLDSGIELGYGSKPPDSKDDTMSGIHARYVLAVGDEAVGLSEALIGDLANITSNATSRRFIIMNPTNPLSYAGQIFKENNGTWSLHTISVFDSPNFHGNGPDVFDPDTGNLIRTSCDESCPKWDKHKDLPPGLGMPVEVLETMVDPSYVADMKRDWGEQHPTYISRVTGEFAWDSGPTLISPEEMAKALDCDVDTLDNLPVLGVDVSRSHKGDMNTVYEYRRGIVATPDAENIGAEAGWLRFVESWNDKNAMRTARKIHDIAMEKAATVVQIDGSGLGGPIADRIRELAEGRYIVAELLGGKPAPEAERDRYFNSRAWWYSELRRKIAEGILDIDIQDKKLQEELLGIETRFPSQGVQRLLIESKEDMRNRGVSSPDYADGANYAVADIEADLSMRKPKQHDVTPDMLDGESRGNFGGFRRISILN